MSLIDRARALFERRPEPAGSVRVCDPSRLNWLYITYNTVEELVRVGRDGATIPAAMTSYRWADDNTLDVTLRAGNRFPDGAPVTSETVKKAFDEMARWQAPHPPGTHFNHPASTTLEATGELAVRFRFPLADGLALGKLRAMHLMSSAFWAGPGFGYARNGTGEGRW